MQRLHSNTKRGRANAAMCCINYLKNTLERKKLISSKLVPWAMTLGFQSIPRDHGITFDTIIRFVEPVLGRSLRFH